MPPRTAARSRAEQRRSEALQLALEAAKAGLIGITHVTDFARTLENYLRQNDGTNLGNPAKP